MNALSTAPFSVPLLCSTVPRASAGLIQAGGAGGEGGQSPAHCHGTDMPLGSGRTQGLP